MRRIARACADGSDALVVPWFLAYGLAVSLLAGRTASRGARLVTVEPEQASQGVDEQGTGCDVR